jgi:hypothetical protein
MMDVILIVSLNTFVFEYDETEGGFKVQNWMLINCFRIISLELHKEVLQYKNDQSGSIFTCEILVNRKISNLINRYDPMIVSTHFHKSTKTVTIC